MLLKFPESGVKFAMHEEDIKETGSFLKVPLWTILNMIQVVGQHTNKEFILRYPFHPLGFL